MTLETPGEMRAYDALARAGKAKLALELLGDELLAKMRAVDIAAFTVLEQGQDVSPDRALHLLYEKYALWKLLRSLEQTLNAGQGAARILGPRMEGTTNG